MTVSVDGVAGDGTILMDTGINYMFLSPPAGTRLEPGTRAPAGTKIAVYLREKQANHGGWPLYHGGEFDLSCTVKAYFALKLAGAVYLIYLGAQALRVAWKSRHDDEMASPLIGSRRQPRRALRQGARCR